MKSWESGWSLTVNKMGEQDGTPKKKIGIMGGSFDPVHNGHVHLAADARQQAGLDQVLLIPARMQPFKLDRKPASGEDRMEMLRLALEDEPGIEPCSYELDQDSVSYTYLTLRAMQERFGPEAQLYFIFGADSLLQLERWKNAEELLRSYSFIVGSRPGYMDEELQQCREHLSRRYGTEIIWIQNQRFDISATEVRQRLAKGDSVQGLIPDKVIEYIESHGLYCEDLNSRGMEYIREHLKPSRLEHTMRVREEAVRLARRFGADPAKAETAAIFHDMAKYMPVDEMNGYIREYGLDLRYLDQPNLAHSKIAALLMEHEFGVSDQELLDAVSSHTTGRAGMSPLEKVVFLADAIEPGRSYPSVTEIRQLAEEDLDLACICMLERTIEYLKLQEADIDSDTILALEDLRKKKSGKQ